jgi:DNA-binding CsgD family transcriptional regulator
MAHLVLSDAEREALERFRSDTDRAATFRNATIILWSANGSSKAELSRALGCSISTIDRVRRAYARRGRAGLLPVKPPGRLIASTGVPTGSPSHGREFPAFPTPILRVAPFSMAPGPRLPGITLTGTRTPFQTLQDVPSRGCVSLRPPERADGRDWIHIAMVSYLSIITDNPDPGSRRSRLQQGIPKKAQPFPFPGEL